MYCILSDISFTHSLVRSRSTVHLQCVRPCAKPGEFKREYNRVLVSTSHRPGAVPPGGGLGVEGEGRKQIIVT